MSAPYTYSWAMALRLSFERAPGLHVLPAPGEAMPFLVAARSDQHSGR